MVAPSAFSNPGGIPTYTRGTLISYLNDRWVLFSLERYVQPRVLVAEDPVVGPWSFTNFSLSDGTYTPSVLGLPPFYADGKYHIIGAHNFGFGTIDYLDIYSTSDPLSPWDTSYTGVSGLAPYYSNHVNGYYVVAGTTAPTGSPYSVFDPWPWVMAYCSTVDGTWTQVVGTTTHLSGTVQERILAVTYDNGVYYRILSRGEYNPYAGGSHPWEAFIESSASIAGPWTALSQIPLPAVYDPAFDNYDEFPDVRPQLLKIESTFYVCTTNGVHYSSDLSGPWSTAILPSQVTKPFWIMYGDPWFVIGGARKQFSSWTGIIAYGTSLDSLQLATDQFYNSSTNTGRPAIRYGDYGNNYFVVADGFGIVNVAYAISDVIPGKTMLRQRQSPRGNPANFVRAAPLRLRQRQTPYRG